MEAQKKDPVSILIVEDEKIVAMDVAGSLKLEGYEILGIVVSGREAIALVEKNPVESQNPIRFNNNI